jgi:hypothetical protein
MRAVRYRVESDALGRFDTTSPRAERLARATFRLLTHELPESVSLAEHAPGLRVEPLSVGEGKKGFAVRAVCLSASWEDDTVRRNARFSGIYSVQGGDISKWNDVQLLELSYASAVLYPYWYGDVLNSPRLTSAHLSPYFVVEGLTEAVLAIQNGLPREEGYLSVAKYS